MSDVPDRPDRPACCYCDRRSDVRPYGPGGAWLCFDCMTASPEREAEAKRQFGAQLDASGPGVTVIGEQTGPRPLNPRRPQ